MFKEGQKVRCINAVMTGSFSDKMKVGQVSTVKYVVNDFATYYAVGIYIVEWISGRNYNSEAPLTDWARHFQVIPSYKLRRKKI